MSTIQPEIDRLPRLAWRVSPDDMTCITFAPTAASARCNAVLAAREAGYFRSGTWPSARARRVEEYDDHYLKEQSLKDGQPRQTWSEDYVRYGI